MALPTFLIVGAPRAGSTSLAAYLGAHPDIFMVPQKELHFFNGRFERGLDWYADHFRDRADAAQWGEATPSYLYNPVAVERMGRTVPEAKLIVLLRDPVERAYSHFWLNRWRGIEPLDFDAALRAERGRLDATPGDLRRAYFEMGRYADQLERVYRWYPRDQVLCLDFGKLVSDPREVVLQSCRFLDVKELVPEATGDRHNHHGPVRSVRIAALSRKLPGPLCRRVRDWNTRDGEYPPMAADTRAALEERFAEANGGLEALIQRPVSW